MKVGINTHDRKHLKNLGVPVMIQITITIDMAAKHKENIIAKYNAQLNSDAFSSMFSAVANNPSKSRRALLSSEYMTLRSEPRKWLTTEATA